MPSLEALYHDFKARPDFALVTISVDQEGWSIIAPFLKEKAYDFPVLADADSRVSAAYGVTALPTTYLVDRNGRIKFGTESNGGFKNITISNCVFDGCFGVAILSVDGAQIEDVTISNVTMRGTVASPIFLRLGARMRGPAGVPVGSIRRVNISNIVSSSGSSEICSMIAGIAGHPIEDVKISNILIQHPGGGTRKDAALQLPEKEKEYPEPTMFGTTPAHAFFIRHAKSIEISDFKILTQDKEERPCFILEDTDGVEFTNIKFPEGQQTPRFVLADVKNFSVQRSPSVPDTEIKEAKRQEI